MGEARGYWPQPLTEPVLRMPVTGWVLSQVDLRIAHFAGLHQMQLLSAIAAFGAFAQWPRRTVHGALMVACAAAVVLGGLLQLA